VSDPTGRGSRMILAKSLLGGVIAVVAIWAIVLVVFMQRLSVVTREHGATELGAVAGGWNYLLHKSLVVLLLTVAFGVGLRLEEY
jgi:hypothetical protein